MASDIDWKESAKLYGAYFGITFGLSILSSILTIVMSNVSSAGATIVSIVMGLITTVFAVVASAGILRTFLNIRRKERPCGLFGAADRALPYFGVMVLFFLIGLIGVVPIVGLVAEVFLLFMYIMAPQYVIDGHGVMESMKLSRTNMNGQKMNYFVTVLPAAGWMLLASLIWILAIAVPFIVAGVTQAYTIPGLVFTVLLFIAGIICLFPVTIYASMIHAEFYDALNGKTLNPVHERSKKPFLIMGIGLLVLTILAGTFMALPLGRRALPSQTGIISTLPTEPADPGYNSGYGTDEYTTPDPAEDNGISTETPSDSGQASGSAAIEYNVPSGYTLFEQTEDAVTYFNSDNNGIWIYKYEALDTFEEMASYYVEKFGATEQSYNGIRCIEYDDAYHHIRFIKGSAEFDINGDIADDVRAVAGTVR